MKMRLKTQPQPDLPHCSLQSRWWLWFRLSGHRAGPHPNTPGRPCWALAHAEVVSGAIVCEKSTGWPWDTHDHRVQSTQESCLSWTSCFSLLCRIGALLSFHVWPREVASCPGMAASCVTLMLWEGTHEIKAGIVLESKHDQNTVYQAKPYIYHMILIMSADF